MRAKFLLCLPARLGVLVISLFQFIFGGIAAGLLWYVLKERPAELTTRLRVITIIWGIVFTIITLMSIAGFIGALFKISKFVSGFSRTLNILFGIQVGVGILNLIFYLRESKEDFIKDCVGSSTSSAVVDSCTDAANHSKTFIIVAFVLPLLIQLYGCYVVGAYVAELKNREFAKASRSMALGTSGYTYEPVGGKGGYAYAEHHHSFGNRSDKV